MNETPSQDKPKTQWGPIIQDLIILMCVMGALGFACKLAMQPFEVQAPTDSLVSLIRKGAAKQQENGELRDQPFLKEMESVSKEAELGVNTPDRTGRTPLMWAVYANNNDPADTRKVDTRRLYYVFSLLETPGINTAAQDDDGFTAMHWAAWSGMRYCLTALAHAGLDINARESAGYTPLMLAAMRGNDETIEALLALGADPSLTREDGSTAASLAHEAKISYDKRDNVVYTLIFKENRAKAYARTVELLKAGKVESTPLTNDQLREIMLRAALEEQAKDNKEADEAAQEEKMELDIEKAAGAPPDTSPDQAPSAHVE